MYPSPVFNRRHEYGGVETQDIIPALHHVAPPQSLDIALKFRTEPPVASYIGEAAVDLSKWEGKAEPFSPRCNNVHTDPLIVSHLSGAVHQRSLTRASHQVVQPE